MFSDEDKDNTLRIIIEIYQKNEITKIRRQLRISQI